MLICPHPLLDPAFLRFSLPAGLGAHPSPAALVALLDPTAPAPMGADDTVRAAVRALLRQGGFKPTGRSKPASEHLRQAFAEGRLGPINLAVDVCNVVSQHSGLPISVVDLGRVEGALSIDLAPKGSSYVFNPSGQVIDIGGLISLFDAQGPCAGPVKDSQRTKTQADTTDTLFVVWGTTALPGAAAAAAAWCRALLEAHGGPDASVA